jgi:formylglycine-generating enzyme required for sulfatase activity
MKKRKVQRGDKMNINFKKIPAGKFLMGSDSSIKERYKDETYHEVEITKPFEMQTTQVTQKQWTDVMNSNPSNFKGDDLPVESVSYYDVQKFIKKLNKRNDGYVYRLPTEAEWEYACADSSFKAGAWGYHNSKNQTHPVAQLKPNKFGLFDMIGNVWEWCSDWYGPYEEN